MPLHSQGPKDTGSRGFVAVGTPEEKRHRVAQRRSAAARVCRESTGTHEEPATEDRETQSQHEVRHTEQRYEQHERHEQHEQHEQHQQGCAGVIIAGPQ